MVASRRHRLASVRNVCCGAGKARAFELGGLMTIRKAVLLLACLLSVALSANAAAQSGDGSLRGIVNDEQGAAMPGVTVTATSPQAIAPAVAVTDASGEYRL